MKRIKISMGKMEVKFRKRGKYKDFLASCVDMMCCELELDQRVKIRRFIGVHKKSLEVNGNRVR